jgi:hypothetical protein
MFPDAFRSTVSTWKVRLMREESVPLVDESQAVARNRKATAGRLEFVGVGQLRSRGF